MRRLNAISSNAQRIRLFIRSLIAVDFPRRKSNQQESADHHLSGQSPAFAAVGGLAAKGGALITFEGVEVDGVFLYEEIQ